MLTPTVRFLPDPATGRSSLIGSDAMVWTLNPTATAAVEVLAGGGSPADVYEQLAERWPQVSAGQLRDDINTLIRQLRDGGLLS
ncbi:PqqD family peptide modification chaperone [Streptomyces carpaticus]|uniref:PqqD family peptide modification chaperone n=1 Tax=Streptomyces carpaticus TaxID=285558 RepID=UPI0031F78CD6